MSLRHVSILSPRHWTASAVLLLCGLSTPACAASAETPAKATGGSTEVVAEIDGKPVSMAELEEALSPQLAALERQRQQLLFDGLAGLVDRKLLEAEAAARGLSVEELIRAEVDDKAGTVSDAEAQSFYDANRARINQPIERVLPQIKSYLANQRVVGLRDDLISAVRAKYPTRLLLEPVRAEVMDPTAPAKGPASAPVTIVEFSDFQCPYCSRVNPTIQQAMDTYGDQLRVVFRQFPLNIHPQAQKAAEASLCAYDQGKFWELHDAMFADQRNLAVEQLKQKAAALGVDQAAFDACLDGGKHSAKVQADLAAGSANGVSGTPAIFVNGRFIPGGAVPFEQLAELINDELQRRGSRASQDG